MARDISAHADTFARDSLPPKEHWPEFLFDAPELRFPEYLNCAAELLDSPVERGFGARPAILCERRSLSYQELLREANRLAAVLRDDLGVAPGNRVLLRGFNNPEMAIAWYAVQKAGAVAVATMPMLRARELAVQIDRAAVEFALCDAALMDEVAEARKISPRLKRLMAWGPGEELERLCADKPDTFETVQTAADDICLLAFTSGTTGVPKACAHSHRNVLASCRTFAERILAPDPNEIFCGTPPLAFTFGLGMMLVFPAHFRLPTVLVEKPGFEALSDAIERFGVTTLATSPTGYRQLLAMGEATNLSSLRKCISAGEPLPAATSHDWYDRTGIRIIDGIGSTEMFHIFISASGRDIRPGATGRPVSGYQACVLGDDNRPLPPGSTGRLAVRGPTGCRYLADERQSNYVIDGWNVTGDIYRMDEDGYFWFVARADDMIISSGYNISGPEVEQALIGHPAVLECAVVGHPDPERGQVVTAFVVLHDPAGAGRELAEELQSHVKQTIAPYKYPRRIEFVSALPKTETGKIQRFKLRKSEAENA